MRFSLLALFALAFVAALTFGVSQVDSGYSAYIFHGVISLLMAATLAIPFVCRESTRPFWAAYATTCAYAMLIRGRDVDPFANLVTIPVLWVLGDMSTLDDRPVARYVFGGLQVWTPAMVGLVAGVGFAVAHRFATNNRSAMNQ